MYGLAFKLEVSSNSFHLAKLRVMLYSYHNLSNSDCIIILHNRWIMMSGLCYAEQGVIYI